MDLGIDGRRALVTGGSRGIGLAVARRLLVEGATVAVSGRDEGALAAAAAELRRATGGSVVTVAADMADRARIEGMVAEAAAAMGGLEILVNNAARPSGGEPEDLRGIDDDLVVEDFRVKFLGYLRCARAAVPSMEAAGWGRIVNVGGIAARMAGSLSAGARNLAIVHLTRTLAGELGRSGITVNAVHPGLTLTEGVRERLAGWAEAAGVGPEDMAARLAADVAIGRLPVPEDVAAVVAFLASAPASAVTGEVVAVSGGVGGAVHG
ncbi:MAG TPA: SDR family NAD(P)-dependent oxidoreductase [Acidimicrobiales bacterium]|nr:SDR family NAD(P)-dependent oxidoreductase [Acidimicrobiales bacterium]